MSTHQAALAPTTVKCKYMFDKCVCVWGGDIICVATSHPFTH